MSYYNLAVENEYLAFDLHVVYPNFSKTVILDIYKEASNIANEYLEPSNPLSILINENLKYNLRKGT